MRSSNKAAFSTYCFHNGSSFSTLYLKILSDISDDVDWDMPNSCVDIENLGKVDNSGDSGQRQCAKDGKARTITFEFDRFLYQSPLAQFWHKCSVLLCFCASVPVHQRPRVRFSTLFGTKRKLEGCGTTYQCWPVSYCTFPYHSLLALDNLFQIRKPKVSLKYLPLVLPVLNYYQSEK